MKKVELLAPAGDLVKLKIAILYGADAVFVGGKYFSLRAKASNFTIDDLKEAVIFANAHNARVHVTVNIVPEECDFDELDEYLKDLDRVGVHAIIVSSIYVLNRVKELGLHFEVHMSTQQSIANSKAIEFFKEAGADRAVLARELNIKQIEEIKKNSSLPIEVFIHGGMCSSYSGRCTLSNVMANRDANKGGCAHSCRWFYKLYQDNKEVSNKTFVMASTDLMGVSYITKLLDLGVDSFKIEGRMKSIHYIASIVSTYRKLIDTYYLNKKVNPSYFKKLIAKAENRITSTGFLNPIMKNEGILDNAGHENPTQAFIGLVLQEVDKDGYLLIQQRNIFSVNDKIEAISPDGKITLSKVYKIKNLDNENMDVANHATEIIKIKIKKNLAVDSLIRKR